MTTSRLARRRRRRHRRRHLVARRVPARPQQALLFSLLKPHMRQRVRTRSRVITVYNLCALAGPFLVKLAIDDGIPRMLDGRGSTRLFVIVGLFVACARHRRRWPTTSSPS